MTNVHQRAMISSRPCALAALAVAWGGLGLVQLVAATDYDPQPSRTQATATRPASGESSASDVSSAPCSASDSADLKRTGAASQRRPRRPLVDPELLKELSGGKTSAKDAVEETVSRMRQVSERIATDHDVGRATRRLQKEILTGLDGMIDAAERSASSSKKNPKSRRKTARPQKDGRQPPQDRKSQAGTANKRGGGTTERSGKSVEKNDRPDRADLARVWGFLPEQEREALLQGLDESFMPKYRDEISRYYRNLAIEATKE